MNNVLFQDFFCTDISNVLFSGKEKKVIFPFSQKRRLECSFQPRCQLSQATQHLKGTQDWEFFWLRFWNLRYFFVSYVKILRFYKKNFLIGPLLGEVRFFRVVLGLRGMKKKFELGPKIFFFLLQFWTLNMTQYSFFENSIN